MAFEYVYPQQPMQGLQYPQPQAQQQSSPQVSPGAAMGIAGKFMGGEGASAGVGAVGSGGTAAAGSGGTAAGSGGTAAAGSGGGMVASAGPWAALAAIIVANEYTAMEGGYRSDDPTQYKKDVATGEVMHQDIEKKILPGLGIDEGSKTSKRISVMANPFSLLSPTDSIERFKDMM